MVLSGRKRRHFGSMHVVATLLLLLPPMLHARYSSAPTSPTATTLKSLQSTTKQPHHVLIYETEVFDSDENIWKGAMPSRWTTVNGDHSPPPINIQAPPHTNWEGEWKIVMNQRSDELGWQYSGETKRRRTWLRSIKEETISSKVSTRTTPRVTSVWTFLKEEWNFKGFGWSFYKSLIFLESVGVSFRIPISQNLDWCERNQLFPSVTSSIGVYYPPTVAVFLNISGNVDYIKWCLVRVQQQIKLTCRRIVVHVLKTLMLLLSLPMRMLSRRDNIGNGMYQWLSTISSNKQQEETQSPINVDISERIGMSFSWRVSRKRGYEFRVSYWHSYLPTVLYLHSLLQFSDKLPMEYWLQSKTGSLGLSTSGPTPDPPHFSCSACLSLSGFHYSRQRKRMDENHVVIKNTKEITTRLTSKSELPEEGTKELETSGTKVAR